MTPISRALRATLLALICLISQSSLASPPPHFGSAFHGRIGSLAVQLGGAATGSFTVNNTIDLEYEIFKGVSDSFTIRSIFAYSLGIGRMAYAYVGLGRRFYIWSTGVDMVAQEGDTTLSQRSTWRYYLGGDLGISQVLVKVIPPSSEVRSSLIDFGGHIGIIYQLSPSVGLEGQAGINYGWGFSSVAVGAILMKYLVGVSLAL